MTYLEEKNARLWIKKKINEYLDSLDIDETNPEYCRIGLDDTKHVLNCLYTFINKDFAKKDKRYQLYEELKKEFEE